MTSQWHRSLAAVGIMGLLLVGCGRDTSSSYDTQQSASSTPSQEESLDPSPAKTDSTGGAMSSDSTTEFIKPAADAKRYASVVGACGSEPTLNVTKGASAPTKLLVADLCPGTGAVVKPSAYVTAHYTGIGLQTGQVFDSSWVRGKSIQFPLDGVIAGWAEGIPGMKVGGRRLLVIPGSLAYGPNPPTDAILPNETLVFVVDIISSP